MIIKYTNFLPSSNKPKPAKLGILIEVGVEVGVEVEVEVVEVEI